MDLFIKILRWIFYVLVIACFGFYIAYQFSEPQNEEYFRYFLYCGLGAIGLSAVRFVLRFI
ncbi:MAG: hypothetical protein Q4B58_03340 [Bacteroidales bacterium]|nr:hypothetical protein [Bacteroidales bacterium]